MADRHIPTTTYTAASEDDQAETTILEEVLWHAGTLLTSVLIGLVGYLAR